MPSLGVRRNHREREKVERGEKHQWVRSQESMALRAGQLELRAAQMKHGKGYQKEIDFNNIQGQISAQL